MEPRGVLPIIREGVPISKNLRAVLGVPPRVEAGRGSAPSRRARLIRGRSNARLEGSRGGAVPWSRRILQVESLHSQQGAGGMARNGESIVGIGGGKPILQAARAPTVRGQLEGVDMAGKGVRPVPSSRAASSPPKRGSTRSWSRQSEEGRAPGRASAAAGAAGSRSAWSSRTILVKTRLAPGSTNPGKTTPPAI